MAAAAAGLRHLQVAAEVPRIEARDGQAVAEARHDIVVGEVMREDLPRQFVLDGAHSEEREECEEREPREERFGCND